YNIYLGHADASGNIVGHNYQTGDKVVYQTNGTAIAPLQNFGTYYVIRIDSWTIQLAATPANATAKTPIQLVMPGRDSDTAAIRHALVPVSIGSLISGDTYYVRTHTTTSFQLADSTGMVVT